MIIKINELVIRNKRNKCKLCLFNNCSSSEAAHVYRGDCKIHGETPGSEPQWCLHQERLFKSGNGGTHL